MAYHTHDIPGNFDDTIEICELFIASGNYYISMYSWIGNTLVPYKKLFFCHILYLIYNIEDRDHSLSSINFYF